MNPNAIILAKWPTGKPAVVETEYGIYCSENLFARDNLEAPEAVMLITNIIDYLVNEKYGPGSTWEDWTREQHGTGRQPKNGKSERM